MFKRRTEELQQSENISYSYSEDNQHHHSQHHSVDTNKISHIKMFHRLFKRFKRNHTPPTSPVESVTSKDKKCFTTRGSDQEQQLKRSRNQKSVDEITVAVAVSNKSHGKVVDENADDNESIHSNSSSYSDYDYIKPSSSCGHYSEQHPKTSQPRKNDDDGNDADDNHDSMSSALESDDSSSYSDYDDYQFLTAVRTAEAARRTSTTKGDAVGKETSSSSSPPKSIEDGVVNKDDGPPNIISVAAVTHEKGDDDAESQEATKTERRNIDEKKKKKKNDVITPVELEALARTAFPDFFSDTEHGVPGAILSDGTESSSDEEEGAAAIQRKTEKYRTKEDEDVAVFMNLAKRMSLKSLLHLLKGHVQSQRDQYSVEYMKQYNDALKCYKSQSSSSDLSSASLNSILSKDGNDEKITFPTDLRDVGPDDELEAQKTADTPSHRHRRRRKQRPSLKKKKQFRWAEVTNDKVRTVVHEIESHKLCTDLWWQPGEMQTIRADLVETVKFYRKRRPGYIQSVEFVARHAGELCNKPANEGGPATESSSSPPKPGKDEQLLACISHQQQVLEDHMKSLMSAEHSYARGLETHIVKMLSVHRKSTVSAVMDEQRECKSCNDDYDTTSHCLREQSIAYSSMSTKFAYAMARCDQIEGLKASMSAWKQE
jgi:hypothetical protein